MKRFSYLILFILALQVLSSVPVSGQDNIKEFYIIYDENHAQWFTTDLMSTALTSLEDAFDGIKINLVVNNDDFNETNLQGSNLVIITNTGLDDRNRPLTVDDSETDALNSYIQIGGSILYMSNPLSNNRTISGHARTLNDLLVDDLDVKMKFNTPDYENVTLLMDDFNNDGNSSHIYIYPENIAYDIHTSEPNNLNDSKFLYYGGYLDSISTIPDYYGNTSQFAYAVDRKGAIDPDTYQSSSHWMEGVDFGTGRAMLIGSTIMFSELMYDNDTKWVDVESNLELFQNIVAWLLKITPLPVGEKGTLRASRR